MKLDTVYKAGLHDDEPLVLVLREPGTEEGRTHHLPGTGSRSLGCYNASLATDLLCDLLGQVPAPHEVRQLAHQLSGMGTEWELTGQQLLGPCGERAAKPMQVDLWCDGSSTGRVGPGGYAAILRWNKQEKVVSGACADVTNNQMEMMAVIAGLEALIAPTQVTAYTDSQYVQKGVTEWSARWKRNGWKNAEGADVANRTLWERLLFLCSIHTVSWSWVAGHSGLPQNERAHELANQARRGLTDGLLLPTPILL